MISEIPVLIPLKDGLMFSSEFLKALSQQTIKTRIITTSRPLKKHVYDTEDLPDRTHKKLLNIVENYRRLQDIALKGPWDLFLYLHFDVIFREKNNIEELVDFLEKNEDYGAVALNTRRTIYPPEAHHVDIACMLIRRYVLERTEFLLESCCCSSLCDNIKKLDKYKKVRYLDKRTLYR